MKRLALLVFTACSASIAQPECTLQTLRGTYLVSYTGVITTASASAHVAILGVLSIDPSVTSPTPNVSGGITFTGFGPTAMFIPGAGTIQVNPDCTGTVTMGNPSTGATEIDQFIYDRDTKTLVLTVVKIALGNVAAIGTWKQIFPIPNVATWTAPPK